MLVFVSDRPHYWKDTVLQLNQHGIFLFLIPFRAGIFYCKSRATGGVIVDCVRKTKNGEVLCSALDKRYPDLPLAALVSAKAIPNLPASRLIRCSEEKELFPEILDFCVKQCGWNTETLSTYALSMDREPSHTCYMGSSLPLSPSEHRLLRCLFYRAPRITSPKDLMRLCYPTDSKHPNNLAVHIRMINQKAARIDPRPLIVNERAKGYRLRDGILL